MPKEGFQHMAQPDRCGNADCVRQASITLANDGRAIGLTGGGDGCIFQRHRLSDKMADRPQLIEVTRLAAGFGR